MNQPLAYIHPEAKIAANVVIEPFAVIYKDVEIGEGSWIGSHAVIMDGARIGKNCRVFPGAVISAVPQDLKFGGEVTTVEIGDNTTIRECVTVNRGTVAHGKTEIGDNCLLMAYVHIAHDCVVGNNCVIANNVQMAGHVEVSDFVVIGGSSAIHQFSKIGTHSMISGGSLVRKDVPPFVKAGREPIRYEGINRTGLERRGFSVEKIEEIREIYRYLFLKKLNNRNAIEQIESELPESPERANVLDFLKNSPRGIIKGLGKNIEDEE